MSDEPQAVVRVVNQGQIPIVRIVFAQGPKGDPPSDGDVQAIVDAAIAARNPGILDLTIIDSGVLTAALGVL